MLKRLSILTVVSTGLIAAGIFLAGEFPILASSRAAMLPVDPVPLVAETATGEKTFTIEVADETQERAAGLMYRETMADDHGMLFVFSQQQMVAFWMKDTPMPLDLLFIGQDGKVRDIERGEPLSEAVISPDEPVRFVLELKAGTAARLGIADGDMLRHPVIKNAPIPGSGG